VRLYIYIYIYINTLYREFKRIHRYFEESSETIMPTLYILLRGLLALDSADDNMMLFNAPDATGTSAIIGAHTLHVSHIQKAALDIIAEIELELDSLLFNNLLFNISPSELVHDDPRSREPGWGFLDDRRNSWTNKPSVLEYIIQNPDIFELFGYINPKGEIVWKPGACHAWMKRVFNLQVKLFIATLFTAGEPGRASELASHLLRNVSGGSIRNTLVLYNLFTLRGTFNKTSHATDRDKSMVRMPLIQVGRQFIRFLAFLRPIYEEFQYVFRPHMHLNARHFLFAGLDRPVSSVDLSKTLSRFTLGAFGFKMSLGQFRQYMSFISSCNKALFESAVVVTASTDDQLGHTGQMDSAHYAGDARLPMGLDNGIFFKTARTSAAIQMLFGHPPDLMIALSAGNENRNRLIDTINSIRQGRYNVHSPTGGSSTPTATIEGILDGIKQKLMPELFLHGTRALSDAFAAVVDLFAPYRIFPRTNILQPIARTIAHPFLLTQLRHFRGVTGSSVGFYNSTQAEVTALMYARKENIAYVSGTGQGFFIFYFQLIDDIPRYRKDYTGYAPCKITRQRTEHHLDPAAQLNARTIPNSKSRTECHLWYVGLQYVGIFTPNPYTCDH
jgi:hypothetical protein